MIAYFDTFSGISGDLVLGALIDLGVPVPWLKKQLSSVLDGFELETGEVFRKHLKATDLKVIVPHKGHHHRTFSDIRQMVENSSLPEVVKKKSLSAFEKIAHAEAHIHGKTVDHVHFHEVGGVDSIVDIVGTFLGIDYLGITDVYASRIPLGSGTVKCAHGILPVPVPATLAILKDVPVYSSGATTEIVTPTGAAIITTLTDSFGDMPQMLIEKSGYGAGDRETGMDLPNLLRVVLGKKVSDGAVSGGAIEEDTIWVIKTNVDDMTPEMVGYLTETLFENKALDVCCVPVGMKKNRPGTQVEVLCRPEDKEQIIQTILTQSTSIGVRYHECKRAVLKRELVEAETRFGRIAVKKIINPDSSVRFMPEYDVVRRIAREKDLPFKDVYQQILTDANSLDTDSGSI